ncbi:hypothetical protein E4P40_07785 [Blastococcus sp. CT_GayMR20]|uniref:hypothetical protein n=1 Tax=Blastococcus sp. CT_GayMR20 TaxID=2559609 RepID=UPI001101D745|nr:hypothetical protein [Blastococcus sp. CT_GayMR20]TFV90109.1 hypothetical protein E4P40_07785 [Blastococcus sp. CT_GayMR20]
MSFTALSPLQQGDALSGLTLAIAGVGPAGVETLPSGVARPEVGPTDAWASALGSDTGWYVLLTQDCDVVREADQEPTVLIAPIRLVKEDRWLDLRRNAYSPRWYAYPREKFSDVPAGMGLAVDLAWTTSILKGALVVTNVQAVRPLTGPAKRSFGEWVANRTGRAPFPDDVVRLVLDPCYEVRKRLSSAFDRAPSPENAKVEARVVAAVDRWFAHADGHRVNILGALTGPRLQAAGLTDKESGEVKTADLAAGQEKLQDLVVRAMNRANEHSGYELKIVCADLATIRADLFLQFSLLLR